MLMTLPTDSAARKEYPMADGLLAYFPAALGGGARVSKQGNDKHNPGEPLHHARGKSGDHANCIVRHLVDVLDLHAKIRDADERSNHFCARPGTLSMVDNKAYRARLLEEVSCLAWRALALSQEMHEVDEAPVAPAARLPAHPEIDKLIEASVRADELVHERNKNWESMPGPGKAYE